MSAAIAKLPPRALTGASILFVVSVIACVAGDTSAGQPTIPLLRGSQETAAPGERPAAQPGRRLDLRLPAEPKGTRIEGEWIYRPFDGTGPYLVAVRRTQGGFYEFEGLREGGTRAVLQFDRASEGWSYRGEVAEGFDQCIPAGARFSLTLAEGASLLDPALPVSAPVVTRPGSICEGSVHYFVSAGGRDQEVRLRAAEDLPGSRIAPGEATAQAGAQDSQGSGPARRAANSPPAARITLGTPLVPDGTPVTLLGSVRDGNDRLWHHVQLVRSPVDRPASAEREGHEARHDPGEVGESDERAADEAAEGPIPEAPGSRTRGQSAAVEPTSQPEGAMRADRERHGAGTEKPKELRSGYLAAENLVVRWECRLVRAGEEGGAGRPPIDRPHTNDGKGQGDRP